MVRHDWHSRLFRNPAVALLVFLEGHQTDTGLSAEAFSQENPANMTAA
jgi:hypothetical protein